jgi:hypothetical protein
MDAGGEERGITGAGVDEGERCSRNYHRQSSQYMKSF